MNTEVIIAIIGLQIISGFLNAYLIKYISQKGKNWADKEDLKEITEIVQDVKQKYQIDNERLRTELVILANRKTKDFSDEKETIILFFTVINEWIWDKTNILIASYDRDNYSDLSNKLILLNTTYNQVNVLFSKVQLLVDNKELIEVGHNLITETLKLHQFVDANCSNLVRNLTSEKALTNTIFDKEKNFQSNSKEFQQIILERATTLEVQRKAILDNYWDKKIELFKNAMDLKHKFKDIVKVHLQS